MLNHSFFHSAFFTWPLFLSQRGFLAEHPSAWYCWLTFCIVVQMENISTLYIYSNDYEQNNQAISLLLSSLGDSAIKANQTKHLCTNSNNLTKIIKPFSEYRIIAPTKSITCVNSLSIQFLLTQVKCVSWIVFSVLSSHSLHSPPLKSCQ